MKPSKQVFILREAAKMPKVALIALLKKLGLESAQYQSFINVSNGTTEIKVYADGRWHDMALGDVS